MNGLEADLDKVLGALANLFASDGDTRSVAILAMSKPRIEQTDYDRWDGGQTGYTIYLEVPQSLYDQIASDLDGIEQSFRDRASAIVRLYEREWVSRFVISTELVVDPQWREKASSWVSGHGVTNQGRARSSNIAPRMVDGLLFRSIPEINLYRALKSAGVSFAPLPVFVRGGQSYQRIEPDFVIVSNGIVVIVEVDGDTVHKESPAEAHTRTIMLAHEGAYIERVNAKECGTEDLARECAAKILKTIQKLKSTR